MRRVEHSFSAGCSNDLILVRGRESKISCSDVTCWFGDTIGCRNVNELGLFLSLLVVPKRGTCLCFAVRNGKIQERQTSELQGRSDESHCRDSLRLLAKSLVPGRNSARFLLTDKNQRLISIAPANIFLWDYRDKVCVVDVDGTITSSTIPAFLATVYLRDYTVCHRGVCRFLSQIIEKASCQLRLLYLTARPIAMAYSTRKFLADVRQDGHSLPEGPLIGYMGTLAGVLKMEMDMSAKVYKYDSLKSCLLTPYNEIGIKNSASYLWGGIGNSIADEQAYRNAGIPTCRIFIIDKKSQIRCSIKRFIGAEAPQLAGSFKSALHLFEGYGDTALQQYCNEINLTMNS